MDRGRLIPEVIRSAWIPSEVSTAEFFLLPVRIPPKRPVCPAPFFCPGFSAPSQPSQPSLVSGQFNSVEPKTSPPSHGDRDGTLLLRQATGPVDQVFVELAFRTEAKRTSDEG